MTSYRPLFSSSSLISTLGLVLVGLALPATSVYAQTASQVVGDDYAPPVVRPVTDGGLSLPFSDGQQVPKGADRLHVTPSGLRVENGFADLATIEAHIEAGLKGRRVSGADLFAAARALEAAYAQAGYLLVRVTLPAQTIKDGKPLRLIVTDGQVEAIDVSALPERLRGRIATLLGPLVGQHHVTKAELERRLLLAGDTPGMLLRSTLKAGTRPGSTVIVVDGRYDPVTYSTSFDNGLSHNLGTYTLRLGADFNSLLGLGEVGYLRLSGYPGFNDNVFSDDPRNRQIIAGFTLPLGTDGVWLNMEGVDSQTHPTSNLSYTLPDHYQRFSTKLGYNWIRTRDLNTSSVLGFDVVQEKQTIDLRGVRADFTQDQLRVLRLTQTGDMITSWGGQFNGSLTVSLGLDAFGARSATRALPLSRDGAEPDFRKLEATASYSQSLANDRIRVSLDGKAQTSFGAVMASSEQFELGGFDWLSGLASGTTEGDAGAALRAEVTVPVTFGLPEQMGVAAAPYVFGAAGISKLEQPTRVERGVTRASSFGTGVRFALAEKASPHSATLSLEYAHGDATGIGSEDRFNLRFISRF